MEPFFLPVFILNTFAVLVDAALGYVSAPRLLDKAGEPEIVAAGIRSTRRLLPVVVALYMFFNCLGYFQTRPVILFSVTGLVCIDLSLQLFLRHRSNTAQSDEEDGRD
ncbi:MAG TPA: hypothetical protein VGJ93_08040 [Desulfuromonadaceae bacterium]|jgi:hypothetical protein